MATAVDGRAARLEYATIGWNAGEAAVALVAGAVASSVALVGFGLDSVVEVSAAFVVLWQLRGVPENRERQAMRALGASFFALALYVAVTAVRDLIIGAHPDASVPGMILTALSLLVMPLLARRKHKVGHELNMPTLIADSAQTRLCAYLSAATLAGLALNAIAGWWWADPLAALVVAGLALNEGREAWSGDHHC
ncbi:MAG: hypothetical protein QOJ09_1947 [Actinomycetota bacterium]|nr:hypothetical protein [Actinomycetota bacterium]